MIKGYQSVHIPVMGTGHSADTPIRVAPLGISSVISLVDDILLERLRKFYSNKFDLQYDAIPASDIDGRSKRISAYLNSVKEIVQIKFDEIKKMPFTKGNDKAKYFDLLPETCEIKKDYVKMMEMDDSESKSELAKELTEKMESGSIDVNIMVKVDAERFGRDGESLGQEYTDAKTALKGFAESKGKANMIFSAGINQTLFTYMTKFKNFYRDASGDIKKKIIVKVSDFRSALIQGKFLAKKGIEVSEFRIESGLNCGGHSFPAGGNLLGPALKEFKEKRESLKATLTPLVKKYYEKMGMVYPESAQDETPKVSVQGGIGTFGEIERLKSEYDVDYVGVGTPFLFVPEATPIDDDTLDLLCKGGEDDYYISDASPVGVQFNNIKDCGSQLWSKKRIEDGKPGSPCPKGFLVNNKEFSEKPICVASAKYQSQKVEEIKNSDQTEDEKSASLKKVYEKECICHFLGNGSLLMLGIEKNIERAPQSICPGPNGAWFTKQYTLQEMFDHFYGKTESIVSEERPHLFAKEIQMYVDYFSDQASSLDYTAPSLKTLDKIKANLEDGMKYCMEISTKDAFKDENLASIPTTVETQSARLESLYNDFKSKVQ